MHELRTLLRTLKLVLDAFVASLHHNMGMGFLALALSTTVWVFVTNEQNPPRSAFFPFRIPVQPVNVPNELDVFGPIDSVVVRLTAPTDLWSSLTEASFEASVDLADLPEGSADLPVSLRPRDARVRVLEVVPPQITVHLDKLRRQVIPVQVNIQQGPPLGFSSDAPRPEVQQVVVLGPERQVTSVDVAVADVNLSSARSNLRQSFPLVPRTARGYDVTGVRLEPQSVVIDIPVIRQTRHATLPVIVDVENSPAPGYVVTQVRVTPQTVSAVGPQDVLEPLNALSTASIDLSNLTGNATRTVPLILPNGATLLDRNTVQVEILIQPVQGTATVLVGPQFVGVGAGLQARSEPASVELVVSGEGLALRDFNATRARVLLDLADRGPGTHEIESRVELPAGFHLSRVNPERVRVTLEPSQ